MPNLTATDHRDVPRAGHLSEALGPELQDLNICNSGPLCCNSVRPSRLTVHD